MTGFSKPKEVSVYAANLYDAVFLYSRALHNLIRQRPGEKIQRLARDGRAVFQQIIKMKEYESKPHSFLILCGQRDYKHGRRVAYSIGVWF